MRRALLGTAVAVLALAGCDTDEILVPVNAPAAPVDLDAYYYARAVRVSWGLGPGWNGESFRVYSRRVTDADFFFIAEVTSCVGGACVYEDRNIVAGQTYEYYVAAVDPGSGVETSSDYSVQVHVPLPEPPPVPQGIQVVALDDANYVRWSSNARSASDFSFYRVYLDEGNGEEFLLGETDSEGFLDLLAANGTTYRYFVAAVDDAGHESQGSAVASGTPRPDYHGEYVYDHFSQPAYSGFRFQGDEDTNPIVNGASSDRHFRLEVDDAGWWLVPGPQAEVYPAGFATTALKCGVAADAACVDVTRAPTSGYVAQDLGIEAQTTYLLRVRGDDGLIHYGAIRVQLLGFDQDGNALMIFDWAYQLQANNPELVVGR
ncbi:MAG: hypothetical protein AMXMBFR53_17190 [Gemmatimonadota bacterium]